MPNDAMSQFVYVTYIRTTPEKVWEALTNADFASQYWFGMRFEGEWTPGTPWHLRFSDGRNADHGEVVEADRPNRLVLKWRNDWKPEFAAEGDATCTITLEPKDGVVKLSLVHRMERGESGLIGAVSGGWPMILSNLKSLLETGEVPMKTFWGA
jgi:uncharacterized protein YndB with AHSA1/START domain